MQLSRSEVRSLVDGLLSIFQKVDFEFSTFLAGCKTRKHCSLIISKRSDGDVMNTVLAQEFDDVETVWENCRTVLYKNDIMEIIRKQLFMACNVDVMFHRRYNEQRAVCPPVDSKSFENVAMATVQQVMCSGKPEVYLSEKVSHTQQSAVGLVEVYPDNMASTTKHGAFVMYMLYAVLLNFSPAF